MCRLFSFSSSLFFLFWISCNTNPKEQLSVEVAVSIESPFVDTSNVIQGVFCVETVSIGKIKSTKSKKLHFLRNGLIKKVFVKRNEKVAVNELIAELENDKEKLNVQLAKLELKKTKQEFESLLIMHFGDAVVNDSNSIVLATLKMKSGYSEALVKLKVVQQNLKETQVFSSESGLFTGQNYEEGEYYDGKEFFGVVLNNKNFKVQFEYFESNLFDNQGSVSCEIRYQGDTIYSNGAVLDELVNEEGFRKGEALLENRNKVKMIDGKKVSVFLQQCAENSIQVPKSAVVSINDDKVIFTYVKGKAIWNEVEIIAENECCFSVSGLEVNDPIIINNNEFLVHNTSVSVR